VNRVHEPVDRERRWSTVDHGHCPGRGSPENGRNGVLGRGTSPWLRENGEGMEVSLTGCKRGAVEGRTRSGDGEERSAEEALGGVALRTRKQVIEGEVSVVMAGGCSSSFYSGRGGAHRGGEGGNDRR
jgi:hypothetical protein